MMKYLSKKIVIIFSIVLMTTGCSSEQSSSYEEYEVKSALAAGYEAADELNEIIDRLSRSCMEENNFEVHPPGLAESSSRSTKVPADFTDPEIKLGVRHMFRTEKELSELGYGFSPWEMYPDIIDGTSEEWSELSEDEQHEYFTSLRGDEDSYESVEWPDGSSVTVFPTEGCQGETYSRVFGDSIYEHHYLLYYVADELTIESESIMHESEEIIDAEAKWSKCMDENGFPGMESPNQVL